jgi:hypothetical protein
MGGCVAVATGGAHAANSKLMATKRLRDMNSLRILLLLTRFRYLMQQQK